MNELTEKDADEALVLLEGFLRQSLGEGTVEKASLGEVREAVVAVILWSNFDEDDYELRLLIRLLYTKESVSYLDLIRRLQPFTAEATKRISLVKARRIYSVPPSNITCDLKCHGWSDAHYWSGAASGCRVERFCLAPRRAGVAPEQ